MRYPKVHPALRSPTHPPRVGLYGNWTRLRLVRTTRSLIRGCSALGLVRRGPANILRAVGSASVTAALFVRWRYVSQTRICFSAHSQLITCRQRRVTRRVYGPCLVEVTFFMKLRIPTILSTCHRITQHWQRFEPCSRRMPNLRTSSKRRRLTPQRSPCAPPETSFDSILC